MEVNAIRTTGGMPEVSADGGHTWQPFRGIYINNACVEEHRQLNELQKRISELEESR